MIELIVVLVLLLVSGAFSGTEVAFTSLSVEQLEELKRKRGARGRLVADLYDQIDVVLTSITIGNNLANLAASALVSALTIRLFGEAWLTVSTAVLTFMVLIIGEVTPKQIGILHNEFVTYHLSGFLRVFSYVFAPVIFLIRTVSNAFTRLTRGRRRPKVTVEGLRHLVRYAGSTGVLNQLNTAIVKNVFRSRRARVGAVMTHRTRIFSLDKRERVQDVFARILESGFSRIPVYDGDPEHIVGIALFKDMTRAVVDGEADATLGRIMQPAVYVPESHSFHDVLGRLREERLNMAVVLDEYGGLAGLVTMEDLVEEFLGEIYDENEVEEVPPIAQLSEDEFRIMADTPVYVLEDHLDIAIPHQGDADTVGGFIVERLGRIPEPAECLETPQGTFVLEEVRHNRIVRVRFRRRRVED